MVMAVALLTAIGCGEEREERENASASRSAMHRGSGRPHMTPIDKSDPKSIEAHFKDYDAFIDKSIATAPPAVANDWKATERP